MLLAELVTLAKSYRHSSLLVTSLNMTMKEWDPQIHSAFIFLLQRLLFWQSWELSRTLRNAIFLIVMIITLCREGLHYPAHLFGWRKESWIRSYFWFKSQVNVFNQVARWGRGGGLHLTLKKWSKEKAVLLTRKLLQLSRVTPCYGLWLAQWLRCFPNHA